MTQQEIKREYDQRQYSVKSKKTRLNLNQTQSLFNRMVDKSAAGFTRVLKHKTLA